jgi:hypothetical protein
MEDQIDDLYEAMEQSRRSAEHDLVEDAMVELTGLQGKPAARQRLLAVIALDDLQAHCVNADERERMEVTKQALKEFIYSAIPLQRDPMYDAAYSYMEDAEPAQLTVYCQLLPIHEQMVEEEEVAAAVEWAAIQEELEQLQTSLKAQRAAEAEAEAQAEAQRQATQPTDPATRRALALQAYERRKAAGAGAGAGAGA